MNDRRLRILDTDTLSEYHRGHAKVLARYSSLPLTLRATTVVTAQYERIKNLRTRVGVLDLRIAAIVLANSGVLITANQHHFRPIPGLPTEDWTLDSPQK
jgi:predicted nucleic acid-binding protein